MTLDIDIGDGADALTINQLRDALDGTYWIDGWDATPGANALEVDVAAGSGSIGTNGVETTSAQPVDFTGDPDSADPRKAVISVDDTGTVRKTLGDAMPAEPTSEMRERTYNPPVPSDASGVVVAEVWLGAGTSSVEAEDVFDRRLSNAAAVAASSGPVTGLTDTTDFIADNTSISGEGFALVGENNIGLPNDEIAQVDSFTPTQNLGKQFTEYEWSDDGLTLVAATQETSNDEAEYLIYDYPNGNIIQQDILTNTLQDVRVTPNDDGTEIFVFYRRADDFNGTVLSLDRNGNTLGQATGSSFDRPKDACWGAGDGRAMAACGNEYAVVRTETLGFDEGTWSNSRDLNIITTVGQDRGDWVAAGGFLGNGLQSAQFSFPTNTNFDGTNSTDTEDLSGFVDSADLEYAIADQNGLAINIELNEQQRVDSSAFSATADQSCVSCAVLQDVGAVAAEWFDEPYVRLHQRSDLTQSSPTVIPKTTIRGDKASKITARDGDSLATYEAATLDDGVAFIELDRPGYLFGWDAAVLTSETEGTADVTVDVQENDGTGWVTVEQDVPRQTSIGSIPPENDVRLKATLTRTDSTDDATIIYAGIRHQK